MNDMTGLNDEEVAQRTRDGYVNTVPSCGGKTKKQIILTNLCTYFNLIFLLIAIALLAVGGYNHLMFLPVIVANIIIGIVQELRSKATLDKLTLLNRQKVTVRRNGRDCTLSEGELVVDDLVLMDAGRQIPADGIVVSGELCVNESLLTGEGDEIRKGEGDVLLSGSFAVSGSAMMRLTRVGADSYAGGLTGLAKEQKKKQPAGMTKSLRLLVRIIGFTMIPLGVLLFWRHYFVLKLTMETSVINTAAALLGMIPDGLFLLVSVALTLGVLRLSKKKVLVQQLSCIESLARVDVFCVDKTGTVTEPGMLTEEIVPLSVTGQEADGLLREFAAAMPDSNATMAALKTYYENPSAAPAAQIVPFSSKVKFSGLTYPDGRSFVLGAPEFLLTEDGVLQKVQSYASEGKRVLVFCSVPKPPVAGEIPGGCVPLALAVFSNPIRQGAAEAFRFFASKGVKIRVISGDNPETVSAVARGAGIEGADSYVDARTLDTDKKLKEAAEAYTVFGRVTPEQKLILVRAMKEAGHTVAMTGDGVNDVLALKEADCSVAMASGSDAAQKVSDLVLLNSDFAAMPAVVAEGRRVINNIERSAALFLVKNIFSFFLAIITVIAVFEYPLTPAQLSLFNMLFIGFPSFVLALEPNDGEVKGKFLRNVLYRATPPAFADLVLVVAAVLFSLAFPALKTEISTIAVVLMSGVGVQFLIRLCRPFNWLRGVLLALTVAGFFGGILYLPELFSIRALSFGGWLVMAVLLVVSLSCVPFFGKCLDGLAAGIRRLRLRLGRFRGKGAVKKKEI